MKTLGMEVWKGGHTVLFSFIPSWVIYIHLALYATTVVLRSTTLFYHPCCHSTREESLDAAVLRVLDCE
jgi:hypothetical protein